MASATVESSEDLEILRDICFDNGLKFGRLRQDGLSCLSLEMYFSGLPRMCGFEHFPNLQQLYIVGQTIEFIENLAVLTKLRELWVVECNLKEISGLEESHSLQKLYLYSNNISKIQNLDQQVALEVLYLNDNKIQVIEGLDKLKNLRELNLADNNIKSLGFSLNSLVKIETLDLSGNPLFHLKELINLTTLQNLRNLSFRNCLHKPSPVSLLSNYSFYTVFHLPKLELLDGENVAQPCIRSVAEAVVDKKKRFYQMKEKVIERNFHQLIDKLEEGFSLRIQPIVNKIAQLDLNMLKLRAQSGIAEENAKEIEKYYKQIESCKMEMYQLKRSCTRDKEMLLSHLEIELTTVGNISFHYGSLSDAWFTACAELVQSRYCGADLSCGSFEGVTIERVTRVENKILSLRFQSSVDLASQQDDVSYWPPLKSNSYRKNTDYLFYIWNSQNSKELLSIIEEGMPVGISHLTNSVNIAHSLKPTSSNEENCLLLIMQVYLGRMAQYDDSTYPDEKKFENLDSLFETKQSFCEKTSMQLLNQHSSSSTAIVSLCECATQQLHWFVKNCNFILPEYIVEFSYVKNKDQPIILLEEKISNFVASSTSGWQNATANKNNPPIPPIYNSKESFSSILRNVCQTSSSLTTLELIGQNLKCLEGIDQLESLIHLNLRHNFIDNLQEVSHLKNLQILDVGHNHLSSLYGLRNMKALKKLDVSFNKMNNVNKEIFILKHHTPNVTHLNLSFNPWRAFEKIRFMVIDVLRELQEFDNIPIRETERNINNPPITKVHYSCEQLMPRSLSLNGFRSCLMPLEEGENGMNAREITYILIQNENISDLTILTNFNSIKWAYLDNNNITNLEGLLESKDNLIELSLSNNNLVDISPLAQLNQLQKLCVDHNFITDLSFSFSHSLNYLQSLSFINNKISSIEPLANLVSLVELYASNNKIANLRDIFHLKKMCNLMIVDLHGNPLTQDGENNYRLFAIYHLKSIKILDGIYIESTELVQAKEIYGGLLTKDFLADQLNTINFSTIKILDFPQFSIQSIDLGEPHLFKNLISINLEHNNLTSFIGLVHLNQLKTLCLNYNRIESLLPRNRNKKWSIPNLNPEISKSAVLSSLEVLHLGYNGIKDLAHLQLYLLPSLKALFLQGNEIAQVHGLNGCRTLEELVLDRNRIRNIEEMSFSNLINLCELHMEENRLRSLSNFGCLVNLQRLFLGMNQLQEMTELEKLAPLVKLTEISLAQNNLSKRNTHKLILLHYLSNLQIIDGCPVIESDRARAEIFFFEQLQFNSLTLLNPNDPTSMVATGYGQNKQVPLKVTNFSLAEKSQMGGVSTPENYDE